MAPTTFFLISLLANSHDSFMTALRSLPATERPLWTGQCHHWIHQPELSSASLNGTGLEVQNWDYLIILKASFSTSGTNIPNDLSQYVSKTWSITAEVQDEFFASLHEANARRSSSPTPPLPPGWSPADHTGLDAAIPPSHVSASLALASPQMGHAKTATPLGLKDFIRTFGSTHSAPIAMFNLLSYLPTKRETYFKYVAAFTESVGSKYGGEPIFLGLGVSGWSSRGDGKEEGGDWQWEDTALIWYPSIWHFGKMLDDEGYVVVDRKFKTGALRDNPVLCCTEVDYLP